MFWMLTCEFDSKNKNAGFFFKKKCDDFTSVENLARCKKSNLILKKIIEINGFHICTNKTYHIVRVITHNYRKEV